MNKNINETIEYYMLGVNWDGVDKSDEFISNNIWQSGFEDDSYKSTLDKIKVGDFVALKSSYVKSKNLPFDNQNKSVSVMLIKAIGRVVENPKDGKNLMVEYDVNFKPKEIYGFSYRHTVRRIDKTKWQEEIGWIFYNKAQTHFYSFSKTPLNKVKSKNQIFYGPPGTGKTYNTINRALEIIDGEVSEDRSEAKARFEELSDAGQIEFVTFHQSYGYEEFVEGIKAIPVGQNGNEDGTEMIYAVSNGIFKNIAKVAKSSAISREKRYRLNAKALNIQAELIEEDDNTYRVLSGSKMRKGEAPSFKNYNYSSLKNKVLKEGKLREESEFYILESDYTFQSLSAASSVILGRQSNGFNDWVEVVENENKVQNKQNYILIIDEINRGNISKIFGELITLIEPSKRLGAEEEIRLRLPYSNELFGVPSNLYIIGTMNTADRSIALMDTALRRRFEFVEMMPNAELLDFEVEGVNLQELLEKINARVEYLYDRDHAIGHAYFMELNADSSLDALNAVMKNKIIPLLQEYFYDDWEKIGLVLNDGFIRKTTQNAAAIFASGMDDEYIEEDKFLYSVAEEFTQESYLNLCQNR